MRKSLSIALIVFVILSLTGISNAQSLLPSPTGTWTLTGAMSQARTEAAAVTIHGGAVLVTGGTDANGVVLATAEIYGSKGTFATVAPMNVPRTGHTATWLSNNTDGSGGFVLVTGGASTGGVILSSAELYDPTANTWTLLASPMVVARSGHPATAFTNSSVLLSGGVSGSTGSQVVLADLEQFGLSGQQFTFSGALPTARKAHAAAALKDGRVLILGGTDANGNTLASTAIYDPTAGTISGGPSLNTPRANATATTLLDGTVLIAGGSYPEGAAANANIAELQSAEIFDPVAGTITPVASKLTQARAGHQAFLLPNNNNVLLVGGTYNGSDLASSELYTPWAGTFTATGSMSTPRSSASGAALFPLADGQLLVAGGSNQQTDATGAVTTTTSSSGELYGFATLETDASDYAPGTPVIMTGTGWKPAETVNLYMQAIPQTADTAPLLTTAADGSGNIMLGTWAPDLTDVNARFYLTAVGASSGSQAQNTFTDSALVNLSINGNGYVEGNASNPSQFYCSNPTKTPSSLTGYTYNCSPTAHGSTTNVWTAVPASGYALSTWSYTPTSGLSVSAGCTANDTDCEFTANSTTTLTVTFVAAPTQLAITTISPASPTAGSAFSVTVQSQNSSGTAMNVTANTTITLTLAAGTGTLGGTLTGTITAGSSSVTITGVTYTKAESILKITATASGGNTMTAATSSAITVQPGAANKLVLGQAPTTTTAGSAFSPAIVVDVEDANGNVVTTDSSTVTLTITNGYFSGLVTTATATAASGVATFTGLTPITAGTTETVKATDGTLTSVTSSAFTVNAAALNKLAFTNTAISTTVGTCSAFTLQSQDQYGNVKAVSGSTTVNLSTSSSGGHFYSNAGCTTSITTATIANGASAPTGSTYYKDSVGGQPTLTASATGITNNGMQVETENLAPSITSANNTAFTYGTAGSFSVTATGYPAPTFSVTAGTLPSGVTLSSAGALSGTPTASGTFTITITASNGIGTNATQSFTLTVNKVQLTVTASAASRTYGAANPTFTYTMTGFVNGDTQATATTGAPSLTTTATTSSAVGSYTITAAAGSLASTNYTFTYANGTLTVSVAPLTITASAQSKNYGTALTLGTTAFTSSGLQNGETVGSVTLTSSGSAATATVAGSPYAITPSAPTGGTFTASNYTITYNTGSLTVSAVPLTITASARSKNYGTALALGTTAFTTGTLYNGDTVSGVTLTSSGAAATATVAGSPYTIVPSAAAGTGLTNYNISYANGSLTVSAAPLTITANNQGKTYGQSLTLGTTAFTSTGLQNGETIGSVTLASSGAAATAPVSGSPYAITPSAAIGGTFTAGNYTISYATTGTLTVSAVPLTITANNDSKIYGQTKTYGAGSTAFTSTGLQNGETIGSVTLASSGGVATASVAGSPYAIIPSAPTGGTFTLGNYTPTYNAGTLTVTQATPSITWAAPAAITYGTALSGTQLNASSTVAGAMAYTPALGAVPSAGTQTLSVTLTPTDATDYTTATQTVSLVVNKATPSITWATPAAITYGTALSGTQLNASSTVAGSMAYTPALGAVPSAGTQTLSVTLTPTDATDYTTATQTVSLVVNKATPTITWAAPSAITYGTALSGTQLNASSTVAGSMAYTPALGAVPSAGTQTLSVTLTPTDATDYTTATQTVSLVVNPVAASVTPNAASKVYGTSDPTLNGSLSGFLPGDGITANYTRTSGEAAGGSYIISAVLSDPNNKLTNYSVISNTAAFTISKATASVTPNAATKVYKTSDPSFSGSLSGFLSTDGVSAAYSRTSGETVAGSPYTISAMLSPLGVLGNYNITYNTAPFTITPAAVMINLSDMTQTYTGTAEAPTVSTLPTGVVVMPTYTGLSNGYGPSTAPPTDPGTYTVTVAVMDPNYSGGTSGTFTIGQLDPALNLGLLSGMPEPSPYGTMVYFSLAMATSPCPTGTVQFYVDNVASGSPVALSGTSCTQPVQFSTATLTPASHTLYAVYSGDAHYLGETSGTVTHGVSTGATSVTLATSAISVNAGTPITFTATVNPGSLDANASIPTGTVTFFDGTMQIGSSALSGGSPDTAALTTTLSAGSHNITASFTDGDNLFTGSSSGVETETVNLIVPTINWTPSPTEFVYGTPLGDSQLKNAAAVDATNNNNTVAGSFSYNFASGTVLPAGTVNLVASFTPTDQATYASTSASVTLTVDAAALTITADNFSIGYGAALPTLTYQVAGLVNGDTASIVTGQPVLSTTASTSSAVGNYPISVVQGTLAAPNYTLQFVNGTLTVTQATVTITASSTSVAYGAPIPLITASYSGFVNGDTSSVLTTPPVCTTAYTPTSAAGSSPSTSCSNAAAINYTFTYVPGGVTVTQADQASLTVTGVPTTAQAYGANFAVGSSGGTGTGAVTFLATGACSNIGAIVAMTSGTGTCSVTATKAADANNNIATSPAATVAAMPASPTVTAWPTAGGITYGQALSNSILTGGSASVGGSFAFTTPSTIPTTGTSSQGVTFTPSDTGNYNSVAGTVSVTVGKANPTVTAWPTAGGIIYGQALSNSILTGGSAPVGGSFAFTTPSTIPTTGTSSQGVTFTPADTGNYNSVAGTVSVTVGKANPTVTAWPTASSITYGQTLSSAMLSGGLATPAGTFAFTAPSTVPVVGTASQSVTFTPMDANDYNSAVGSVSVTVMQASQTITFVSPGPQNNYFPLTLAATASSGLVVSYTVTSGPATLNGSTLTFTGTGSVTVKAAQAGNSNYSAATPVSVTFTVNSLGASTPTFSPAFGIYNTPQTVTLADASPGVTIYYTTNGTIPTTASTKYTGPFTVSSTATVFALAVGNGYGTSTVGGGVYTIK